MEDNDKIRQRFELLKMARELLNEDYINQRAQDHNKWVAENDESWRTTRRNIPYPPFAQYPTDEEIVRAASNLYNFIYLDSEVKEKLEESKPIEIPEKPIQGDNFVLKQKPSIVLEPIIESVPVSKSSPVVDIMPEPINEKVSEEVTTSELSVERDFTYEDTKMLGAQVSATKNLLPGWMRRIK